MVSMPCSPYVGESLQVIIEYYYQNIYFIEGQGGDLNIQCNIILPLVFSNIRDSSAVIFVNSLRVSPSYHISRSRDLKEERGTMGSSLWRYMCRPIWREAGGANFTAALGKGTVTEE